MVSTGTASISEQVGGSGMDEDRSGSFDLLCGHLAGGNLHRPLMDWVKKALRNGGLLVYETFTIEQYRFGKPRNPIERWHRSFAASRMPRVGAKQYALGVDGKMKMHPPCVQQGHLWAKMSLWTGED